MVNLLRVLSKYGWQAACINEAGLIERCSPELLHHQPGQQNFSAIIWSWEKLGQRSNRLLGA